METNTRSILIYQLARLLSKVNDMSDNDIDMVIKALNSVDNRWVSFGDGEVKECEI